MAPAAGLFAGLIAIAAQWLPHFPGGDGRLAADYAFFLPNLLAGYYWHLGNPWGSLPWFTPAQCGGFPLHADPQGIYLSLPQILTLLVDPLRAVQVSLFAFAAAGYAGAYMLARRAFRLRASASVLAGLLFMLNGFYAVRMMVGHLGFAPFMLLPGMLACLLSQGMPKKRYAILPVTGFAAGLAAMVEGGMAALLAPVFLSIVMVLLLHAIRVSGRLIRAAGRLAAGTFLGLALCAGKLAAMVALMGVLPRDAYPLPGYPALAQTAWVALRAVFAWPSPDMQALGNTPVRIVLHEFDYGVGPIPLLLMAVAGGLALRSGMRLPRRRALLMALLGLLLLVPLALNTLGDGWTPFLKTLPVLRNSSLLVRWFAAYLLPSVLGGAIALDSLARRQKAQLWALSWAGGVATLAISALTIGSGFQGFAGGYDPAPVDAAWAAAAAGGRAVPVTHIDAARQDALVSGGSPMNCYQPLFGYALEFFPIGSLHAGAIGERTGLGMNIKNPACYVYPAANFCQPGDPFTVAQAAEATRFAQYRPFAWHKPLWARAADWLGIASCAATLLAVGAALLRVRLAR